MRMMLQALTFVLLLHLASGAKITSIQTFHRSVYAKVGHLLVIPCVFNKDEPLQGHKIELEWGMTPENGGEYRPLIRLRDTMPMPVPHPNPRARLNPMQLPSGECAMVIDPVKLEDSGTYTIRLAIDDEEYKEAPEVKVHVWEFHGETESSPERFSLPIDQPKKDQLLHDGVLHSKSPPQRTGLPTHHPNEDQLLQANGGVLHAKSPPQQPGLSTHHPNKDHSLRANDGVLHTKPPPKGTGFSPSHPNEDHSLQDSGDVLHTESSLEGLGLSNDQPKMDRSLQANDGVRHANSLPKQSGHPNEVHSLGANGRLPSNQDINPTISTTVPQAAENCDTYMWLVIVLGVFNFLLLMFSGPAYYFACKYLLLKTKKKQLFSAMEERERRMAEYSNIPTVVVQ